MKAIVLETLNEFPIYTDVNGPEQSDENVIVELKASALNHRDLYITQGLYPGIKQGSILGSDGAGIYEDREVIINPGLYWGDNEAYQSDDFQVLGMPIDGTFAEAIAVPKAYIYDKPAHLSMEEAAALPLGGVTAYRTLFTRCQATSSDKILISGVGGGVAQYALQYALAIGAEVYVTSGDEEKIATTISMGAAGGVNYKNEGWAKELQTLSGGIDVVIDSAGGDGFHHFIKISNPGARIGFYGATLGKINNINPQIMFWRQISMLGSTMGSDRDFADMLAFVTKHKISPIIDKVYPLHDAVSGFQRMDKGAQFGKIVFSH